MPQQTLIDIAKLNGNDALVGLIEQNLNVAPELQVVPMRSIKGTSYRVVLRDSFPTASFRAANEATTASKSGFSNKLVECYIATSLIQVDKAVAMAYEDGPDAWKAIEASGVVQATMQTVGRQFYYGTNTTYSGDAKGFPGLIDLYDSTNMVVDAGGTTATTGSSVWLVKFGPQFTQFVAGNGGNLTLSPWSDQVLSGVPSYVSDMTGWFGLQSINPKGIVRIKKCTADSGKGCTDALISSALSKFPVGVRPDAIFMSRRSLYQLQASRTATYVVSLANRRTETSGLDIQAPVPESSFGIPIYPTDSLSDVEALTL